MALIEQYRQLPDAGRVPDEVWEVQRALDRLDVLQQEIATIKLELSDHLTPRMMAVLRDDWTDAELRVVGLLT